MQPAKLSFKVYQGASFLQQLRWESETKVYIPISSISKSAPIQITVADNTNLPPVGWRTRVTNVLGMKEINMSSDEYQIISNINGSVVTFNQINSLGYSTYTSGGVLEFNSPVSLSGYTARMQIRKKLKDTDVVLSLTTENGGLLLDDTNKTITIKMTSEQTASLDFTSAVYDLELSNSIIGSTQRFAEGNIVLKPEVTR